MVAFKVVRGGKPPAEPEAAHSVRVTPGKALPASAKRAAGLPAGFDFISVVSAGEVPIRRWGVYTNPEPAEKANRSGRSS